MNIRILIMLIYMILKGVTLVHNDKLGHMVLKGVNWVHNTNIGGRLTNYGIVIVCDNHAR